MTDKKKKKSTASEKKPKETKKKDPSSKTNKEKKSTKIAKIPKTIMVPTSDESSGEESSSAVDNLEDIVEQLQRMNASWASISYDDKSRKLKVKEAKISHDSSVTFDLRPPEFLPLIPKESVPSKRIHTKKDASWIK
jgi:hypothetical protein